MELKMIDINKIVTNPLQPRQEFDREKLQELANSIREGELLQPIVVRKNDGNKFEIVCGERRYKAFQILKEPKIPAIVRNIKDDTDALEKSLIENIQRDDLTSVERENAIGDLWDSGNYKTQRELGKKLGTSERLIGQLLEAREFRKKTEVPSVSTTTLSETSTLSEEPRKKLIQQISDEKINARDVRDVVRKVKEFPEPEQQLEILDLFEQKQEEDDTTFDEVVTKYKEIAEEKRLPEIEIEEDPSELRFNSIKNKCFNSIKNKCDEILWITPVNINIIENKKFRQQTIEVLKKTQKHIDKLLIALGETEVIDG